MHDICKNQIPPPVPLRHASARSTTCGKPSCPACWPEGNSSRRTASRWLWVSRAPRYEKAFQQLHGEGLIELPPPAAMRTTMIALEQIDATDARAHVHLNAIFHRALVAAAGNTVLADLYASLSARQDLVAMVSVSIAPARLALINREHRALIQAIAAHDATGTQAILAAHLSPVGEIMAHLPAGATSRPWTRIA